MFLPNRPVQPVKEAYKKGGIAGGKLLQAPTDMHLSQNMDGTSVVHVPKSGQAPAVVSGGKLAGGKLVKTKAPAKKAKKTKAKKAKK